MDFEWTALLAEQSVQALLKDALATKMELLPLSAKLARTYAPAERAAIIDYYALLPRIFEKFGTDKFLLCDRLALEQSTAKDIAEWKALLFPGNCSVNDLCCGMGGDSFALPGTTEVKGADLSAARRAMYAYNTAALGLPREAVDADARALDNGADFFEIDPARRENEGDNQRDYNNMTPAFAEILALAEHYRGGMVKLPPGYPESEFPENSEAVYIGNRRDCRECLLLLGSLAKRPGRARAIIINDGKIQEWAPDTAREKLAEDLPERPLGRYLAEPLPALVRSHVFTEIGREKDCGILSPGIAYLTSDSPLQDPGFLEFEVLDSSPLGSSAVRAMLKKHDIGRITLKKRGVEIIPEKEIKRLDPRGSREAILFYTRIRGEKAAILALPLHINSKAEK